MLIDGFYNLTDRKKTPMVTAESNYGGICLGFTDDVGDELTIVLSPKGLAEVIRALDKAGFLDPKKKSGTA